MNKSKMLALVGIGLYVVQVLSSRSDANGNSLSPNTLILFSGTASLIYVVIAGVMLWKMGHRRIAWALPITFLASGSAMLLTPNPSVLNLILNAIKVVAFATYIYAAYLLFTFDKQPISSGYESRGGLMFGFAKRVQKRQLERAVLIQNTIMITLFGAARDALVTQRDSPNRLDSVIAAAINQLFGKASQKDSFSGEDHQVFDRILRTIRSDVLTEMLIVRVLYDIISLSIELKNERLSSEFPNGVQILQEWKVGCPELFEDRNEKRFKMLIADFADKYKLTTKTNLLNLFL